MRYKDFFIIWAFTLFIWNFFFTFSLSGFGPGIIIGGKHAQKIT
jgi:hypothetical protein